MLRPLPSLALLTSLGCAGPNLDTSEPVPDWSLEDTNQSSASYGEAVSPSDFLGRVSAWYFGHGS
jgi:hypothetical protein